MGRFGLPTLELECALGSSRYSDIRMVLFSGMRYIFSNLLIRSEPVCPNAQGMTSQKSDRRFLPDLKDG